MLVFLLFHEHALFVSFCLWVLLLNRSKELSDSFHLFLIPCSSRVNSITPSFKMPSLKYLQPQDSLAFCRILIPILSYISHLIIVWYGSTFHLPSLSAILSKWGKSLQEYVLHFIFVSSQFGILYIVMAQFDICWKKMRENR